MSGSIYGRWDGEGRKKEDKDGISGEQHHGRSNPVDGKRGFYSVLLIRSISGDHETIITTEFPVTL